MNKTILTGRITKEPVIRYTAGANQMAVAHYTLAVGRLIKREGEPTADFIRCVAFGKSAEFAGKYLTKGTKIAVTGRIQTGNYTNRDGQKIYTTDVIVESQEFCESKSKSTAATSGTAAGNNTFVGMPPEEAQYQYFN